MNTLSASALGIATRRVASASFAIAIAALALPQTLVAQTARDSANAPKIRLVVQITVDQFRGDYIDRYASQYTGGLAYLGKHAAFFTNATHDHGVTETAPGHATLWSGRYPGHTGIARNAAGVQDPQSPLLNGGKSGPASPFRFRGSALFDWIRSDNEWSKALSVSRKDRGAILPLGRAHQNVYWYGQDGNFTTSTYYRDTLPSWVQKFNARNMTKPILTALWEPLLPASAYTEIDSVPTESSGKDFMFPHKLPADTKKALEDIVELPWMDEFTAAMALEGVNAMKLGLGVGTDVLAVSFSATDAVGHRYGPDSKEMHDQLLRLDKTLGKFFDSLFVMRDSNSVIMALSADHGMQPYPALHFPGTDPMRGLAAYRPLLDSARKKIVALGGQAADIDFESGMLALEKKKLREKGINVDSIVRTLQTSFGKLSGIQSVYRTEELPALAASGNVIARRWLHAISPDMEVALVISLKPYYYWSPGTTATHGSPNQMDAWVPIVFAGAPFKAGRYPNEVHTVDIAPTIAAALGISPIEAVDGNILSEALRNPPAKTAPTVIPKLKK